MTEPVLTSLIIFILLGVLIAGRWRYDGVVLVALAVMVLFGLVPAKEAFTGFGHPAVITVALVLLISKALEKSGFINMIGDLLQRYLEKESHFILVLMTTAAFLSSFMNNIGAMAMLLPITIGIAQKREWNPSKFLMPLAFASILGGMNTKIGTPPNIIISEIKGTMDSSSGFFFFDYTLVGLPVSLVGILFIFFFSTYLVRLREGEGKAKPLVDIQDYLIEMTINEESPLVGKRIHELSSNLGPDNVFLGVVSDKGVIRKPHNFEVFEALQIVVMKISPDDAAKIQTEFGLSIDPDLDQVIDEGELGEIEAMITPRSRLIGRKYNYFKRMASGDLFLLGLWRQGSKLRKRLAREIFKAGDVLLLSSKGSSNDRAAEKLELLGLMPLWQRELDVIRDTSKVYLAIGIFVLCLSAVILNILDIIVAFLLCVIAFSATRLLTGEGIYRHVDWPVVVMLGAMIPIGEALSSSGVTSIVANEISQLFEGMHVVWLLGSILIVTMLVSDLVNNAATAVIMAPLALSVAEQSNLPHDPFLMIVAIGASCAFLSPIGHQCNTLVMGPGNYRFGDYWRLGLPLEIIITIICLPLVLLFWF
tara:strand:- start:19795 stop:21570 length:1776 start_codon:yes stop_codon:yes gene_type:complete